MNIEICNKELKMNMFSYIQLSKVFVRSKNICIDEFQLRIPLTWLPYSRAYRLLVAPIDGFSICRLLRWNFGSRAVLSVNIQTFNITPTFRVTLFPFGTVIFHQCSLQSDLVFFCADASRIGMPVYERKFDMSKLFVI